MRGKGKRVALGSLLAAAVAVGASCGSSSAGPASTADATAPASPGSLQIGYDAYRHWDLLPSLRLGVRTYMRSTYDRAGGNEAADASHYLREVAPGDDVPLDVEGTGTAWFFRANHWHGSP